MAPKKANTGAPAEAPTATRGLLEQLEELEKLKPHTVASKDLANSLNEKVKVQEARLRSLRDRPLVVRLGEALHKQQIRPIDLLRNWDANNDGVVSRAEVYEQMCALNLRSPREECDELFDSLDEDASGVLELNELKKHLRKLTAKAAESRAEIASMEETVWT